MELEPHLSLLSSHFSLGLAEVMLPSALQGQDVVFLQVILNSIRSFIGTGLFCLLFLAMRLMAAHGYLPQHREFLVRQSQFYLGPSFVLRVRD